VHAKTRIRSARQRERVAAPGRATVPGRAPASGFARATWLAGVVVVAGGALGWLWLRHWGRVPFSVPSQPWYHCFPFYVFPHPVVAWAWAVVALPVAVAVAAGVIVMAGARIRWPARLACSALALFILALAVAALGGGPRAWWAPFDYDGEYPAGAHLVGAIPLFLHRFTTLLSELPSHAQGHPAGAMVFYGLIAGVRLGLPAAAVATVAVGALGVVAAGALSRDELGEPAGRLAVALWCLSPGVVLYVATSADAVFATVLGLAVLAAHRGLVRRSWGWTLAGGVLLWAGSMLTYSAVLLLVFLGIRAAGAPRSKGAWVARWAAATAAVVIGLMVALRLGTGYDPLAAVRAVHRAYQTAPGSARRPALPWIPGDVLAFGGMLGVPLLGALAARAVAVVRERAWASVDAAALATLLAASSWGFSRGEVERIFQFLVPLVLVPVVRQLLAWRVRPAVVGALLVAQTLAVQMLFATRW
jgi:methylthioxylose transferase